MNSLHQNDHYYDNSRAPRGPTHQSQTLHRRPSRPFDAFGHQQDGLYANDTLTPHYDAPRYDRMNNIQNGYGSYDMGGIPQQAWNNTVYPHNNLAALGVTTRGKPGATRGRPPIPAMWMDQGPSNGFTNIGNPPMPVPSLRADHAPMDDEDLIPTAIVIKNIPFAVKKEQLVQVMTDMFLPLPYAFNYHFDNGVFRGLAFANFTTAEETAAVIQAMNHLELHGRKLRVEYKKMLPQAERDRIEREKRERRGQLEEQHRPVPTSQLQSRPSVSSMSSAIRAVSPSPNPLRSPTSNLDMNDPHVLSYYSKLILFQGDSSQGDIMTFPPQLPPNHRKVIHGLAHNLGLGHESQGIGEQRQVCIFRNSPGVPGLSPTIPTSAYTLEANRPSRGLNRAATTEFEKTRDPTFYGLLGRQSSGYLYTSEPQVGLSAGNGLRTAKSTADLRSFTPSPAHSNSSFPAALTANISRFADYGQNSPGATSSRSNLGPANNAAANSTDALVNSMNNITLTPGYNASGRPGSPQRLRGMMSWDRDMPGPIGGHRSFSANVDDQSRTRSQNGVPARQPRGPVDRGTGFTRGRQNGHQSHGSDELPTHNGVDTVVE